MLQQPLWNHLLNYYKENKALMEGEFKSSLVSCRGSGESTRLPPMWLRFDSQTRRHMWIEFVGSLLCSEKFFSGYSGFPISQKPTFDLIYVNLFSVYGVPNRCSSVGRVDT